MSNLLYYLVHRPRYTAGHTPVTVEGNWFWKGGKRFSIKGVSYIPREADNERLHKRTLIDPLSDEWLPELRKDISYFQQLGINTISISTFDTARNHDKALKLLADEGISVLLTIFNELQQVLAWNPGSLSPDCNALDPSTMYTAELIDNCLRTISQTVHHPNVLAYNVSAYTVNTHASKKFAVLVRAAIRDCKHWLRLLDTHHIPVGVGIPDIADLRRNALLFYTAGSPDERADFVSLNCFSWAGESSFKISGYEHLVKLVQDVPAPMFFSAYGTAITQRVFSEVECLHGPDMSGVFSGGVVYTYSHHHDDYGLVRLGADGVRRPTNDYWQLTERLRRVDSQPVADLGEVVPKDYESWRGEMPDLRSDWKVDIGALPAFPLDRSTTNYATDTS